MDDSEKLVEVYLKSIGVTDIRYEPDGNIPPDFLADGRVAVEVRRLNQNYDDGSGRGLRGLEEVAIPFWHRIRNYLTQLGSAPTSGQSWYVFYRFNRPIPEWTAVRRQLDKSLRPFMIDPDPQPFEAKLSDNFSISVSPSSVPRTTFFCLAGHTDKQSGGWLINEIDVNLKHCIAEKTGKIARYRARYPEWCLVLPDHIGYGLDDFERSLFLDQVIIEAGGFDKIVLLDPRDPARAFQVYP